MLHHTNWKSVGDIFGPFAEAQRHSIPFKEELNGLLSTLSDTGDTIERWFKASGCRAVGLSGFGFKPDGVFGEQLGTSPSLMMFDGHSDFGRMTSRDPRCSRCGLPWSRSSPEVISPKPCPWRLG